ncbi:hypothetical protein [Streptomyces sp. TUS-ST3]|uniref:hypothetical protein n=1 Tax=Streptomyces sp. TUS-ST3 TaxID=3025591 RepID=UPI0024E09D55|nr:hypothetical protein [Streptomyces sp. TUS-ST3]
MQRMVAMDGTADVEVLPSARVNVALDRPRHHDVHYRFVLDISDLDRAGACRSGRTPVPARTHR